jgi:hypothetical protein
VTDASVHERSVSLRARVTVATLSAVLIGGFAFAVGLRHPQVLGRDFTFQWRAARAVLAGLDPYKVVVPTGPFPYSSFYYYPLPAAFLTLPVAGLSAAVAAAVMMALSAFALAFALCRNDYARLPLLLSSPCIAAAQAGQNIPMLLAAGLMIPWLQAFAIGKPTIGAAVWVAKPSWWPIAIGLALSLIAFLLQPAWPLEWIHAASQKPGAHLAPITVPGGFLLLLAVFRWRRPEARLLLAMSVMPQTMTWYDPMPVMLFARSLRESLVVALLSQIGFVAAGWYENTLPAGTGVDGVPFGSTAPFALWCVYIPALFLVLRLPKDRSVERLVWE